MNQRTKIPDKAGKSRSNENLLPLMQLSRALLKIALSDDEGRMLDLNLNVTLAVSVAASEGQKSRYNVRCAIRDNRIHVSYGMDALHKYAIPNNPQYPNLAEGIYAYLRNGVIAKPVGIELVD